VLTDCPYCNSSIKLVKQHDIKHKIITIDPQDKDKYKTNKIDTFPQIYIRKEGTKKIKLLGGNDKLIKLLDFMKTIDNFGKDLNLTRHELLQVMNLIKK
jgi:glutaredoxin